MEHLPNGMTLALTDGAFPLSTDSMLLSHFIKLPRNANVLDLGSGCGTLGLLLCAKDPACQVTGLELDAAAHQAAVENIDRNQISARMESICADLRSVSERFSPGQFSVCISNPPYFSGGPASTRTPLARREDTCTPEDLFQAVAWALKYGGDFFLVQKPNRMAELIAKAAVHKLEAKRLCLVRHKPDAPISLILLQFRKGANPGLILEELILHNPDNTPTRIYKEIYHLP